RYNTIKKEDAPKKRVRKSNLSLPSFRKLIIIIIVIGIFMVPLIIHHMRTLGDEIENKFSQPQKWNLPSRIYSDAEYIYPGYNVADRALLRKLDRLGYRNMGEHIGGSGEYSENKSRIDIYLHNFQYPEEAFVGFPVRLDLSSNIVTKMTRLDTDEEESLVRLEPELVASIFDRSMEDRTEVTLKQVPSYLLEAIILVEDERFFKHKGVDPIGMLRAFIADVKAVAFVQGGSTLTQQLVKNFFLYSKKSFTRKFNEILMAIQLERHHTKSEILQAYINEIYLGQRGASSVSGVAEASRLYFGKDIKNISIGESAMLAGMIKHPYKYNPISNPEKAKERRNFILQRMYNENLIDETELVKAMDESIITPRLVLKSNNAPFFVDFVKAQLVEFYPEEILQSEGLKIFTTLDMNAQLIAQKAVSDGLQRLEEKYGNLLPPDHIGLLQSCLVALTPSNGYIRVLAGGRNYGISQYNHCFQAMRQPGSTFKPFVYLTAFDSSRSDKEFTPSTLIDDSSFEMVSGGELWRPKNYDKKEHGRVTLRTALENSYNIATTKVAIDAGLENVVATAKDAGIKGNLLAVPSLALGSFEVTPLGLAAAYTIFPNAGIRTEPISIMQVVTKDGKILEHKPIMMKRKFDPRPIYLTTYVMQGVIDHGTARAARVYGVKGSPAGKTGTTSDYRDAWFVGFTPNLLATVWVGFDDNVSTKMSGSRAALPIWSEFMSEMKYADKRFAPPKGIKYINVDPITGLLSGKKCPDYIVEAFIDGTEPEDKCSEVMDEEN
ncbi:MAG: PBP1A family penicillin-binding protein, partial [Pseudomonadota bacterium]